MAGLGRYGRVRQEEIRRSFSAPTVTQTDPAKITFFEREVYGLKQSVFECQRISAHVTREQCAASYLRNNIGSGCYKCPIGSHFSGGAPVAENMHTAVNDSLGLACVRCERNGHTATRYIGRFRLVQQHTLCLNCFNRQKEVEKYRAGIGGNSKGGVPQKWQHLQQATITIEDAAGEWQTLDIGLRIGRAECERYVARIHPGSVIVDVFIGGASIPAGSVDPSPADWHAASRETKAAIAASKPRKKKTPAVAPDRQAAAKAVDWDDWDTPLYAKPVASDESDADGNGLARRHGWLPPMDEQQDADYRASFDVPVEPEWQPSADDRKVLFERPALLTHADVDAHFEQPFYEPENDQEEDVVEHVEPVPKPFVNTHSGMTAEQLCNTLIGRGDDAPKGVSESDLVLATGCAITGEYVPAEDVADAGASTPEPEAASEPIRKPQKPLTGKQLRKLEKAQRRAERGQPAPERMTIGKSPRAIAVTARAFVRVAFELNGYRA